MILPIPEVYEGSNIAAALPLLEPFFLATGGFLDVDAPIGVGLQAESAYVAPPPRMVILGPGVGEDLETYRDPKQQPEDGTVIKEALEPYIAQCWGRTVRQAQQVRDAMIRACWTLFSPHWTFELSMRVRQRGGTGELGWAIDMPFFLAVPIYSVRTRVHRVTSVGLTGTVVKQLVPPDPSPDPIPGLP